MLGLAGLRWAALGWPLGCLEAIFDFFVGLGSYCFHRGACSGCSLKLLSCAKLGGGRFEFFCVLVLALLLLGLRPAVAAL